VSRRGAPQAPPDLPGFTVVELLGSGGFADVFLYEQQLPRRRVAVKVLLTEKMTSNSIAAFTAEANVMAMLSTHPAIVTIYQAGLADDGRPYLVMEYCPKPNLQARYRREPFSVAETLRVGVQVAAAVETAHRAGVLHRDIKPANILVTEYNRPALTDFGIASTTTDADAGGLSIPWSPPEALGDVPGGDARSDVWALGATVYSLLAGRSPFELPGQRNGGVDLIHRIETLPLPPLERADVPPSLQRVLARAMSKAPGDRFESALAFARALQKVQIELAHAVTPIDILDDGPTDGVVDEEDDGRTRVRGVVSIDPDTATAAGPTRPPAPSMWAPEALPRPVDDRTVVRPPVVLTPEPATPAASEAALPSFAAAPQPSASAAASAPPPPPVPGAPEAPAPAGRSRRGLWFAVGAVAFVAAVAVILAVALPAVLGGGATPSPTAAPSDDPIDVVPTTVAPPADLTGTVTSDGVVFSWTNPEPADGDTYLWSVVSRDGGDAALSRADEATVTVPEDPSGTTCIEVLVRRTNGQASEPASVCAP
jgi:eukaryotic-like serine/threonine-protein kinase